MSSQTRRIPADPEAEAALLGAALLAPGGVDVLAEFLKPSDFYDTAHAAVCDAILTLFNKGDAVDVGTVASEMRRAGTLDAIGGIGGLHELEDKCPATSSAPRHARTVVDAARHRALIHVASEIAELGYQHKGDAAEAVDRAEQIVFAVADSATDDTVRDAPALVDDMLELLNSSNERAVPCGLRDLDEVLLGGLTPGALIVVGARPAMGKTAFALGAALHCAKDLGRPALVFSLEMSGGELMQRLVCMSAGVDSSKLRARTLSAGDQAKIDRASEELRGVPLFVDDNPSLTLTEMRAKARRIRARAGDLGVIVVDYLQLMAGRASAENRQVQVAEMSRGLKVLARELDVPVVALSQLTRNVESRADKRPQLADLKESGAVEQDSDVVIFIYRDEVYDPHSNAAGTAELAVAKHRNGPTTGGRAKHVAFLAESTRFADLAPGAMGPSGGWRPPAMRRQQKAIVANGEPAESYDYESVESF